MPRRSLNVQVSPSGLIVHEVAKQGYISAVLVLNRTKPSQMPDTDTKAHDGATVNARNALHGANAGAFRQCADCQDFLFYC
jgi:hypothetical protein